MIQTQDLTKRFDTVLAMDHFTTEIPKGSIYGLVGSNGSGKSTFLRMIAGVYKPDEGSVTVDGLESFENNRAKEKIFLVADELYFPPHYSMDRMADHYARYYPHFDREKYREISGRFPIEPKRKISTFSKGMKRQTALILAMSCQPDYLLLDEAFDGLDPVIRVLVRKLLADEISQRQMTVIIASHNLRELEDLCDQMGLLHQGRVIFQREIDEVKLGFCKVQAAFAPMIERPALDGLNILQYEQTGSVLNLVVRGGREEILGYLEGLNPLFVETVPLTLEEVFIHEMEAIGYDYNKIIF